MKVWAQPGLSLWSKTTLSPRAVAAACRGKLSQPETGRQASAHTRLLARLAFVCASTPASRPNERGQISKTLTVGAVIGARRWNLAPPRAV